MLHIYPESPSLRQMRYCLNADFLSSTQVLQEKRTPSLWRRAAIYAIRYKAVLQPICSADRNPFRATPCALALHGSTDHVKHRQRNSPSYWGVGTKKTEHDAKK